MCNNSAAANKDRMEIQYIMQIWMEVKQQANESLFLKKFKFIFQNSICTIKATTIT